MGFSPPSLPSFWWAKAHPTEFEPDAAGGGYFLWIELPEGTDALRLQRRASHLGISIAPGPMFSASRGFGHCLRLNCGRPLDARIDSALVTLGKLAATAGDG